MNGSLRSGPSGGIGGHAFDDPPPGAGAHIREIRVWSSAGLEALQLIHAQEGELIEHPKRGQSTSGFTVLKLEPGEFIKEISGRYSSYIDQIEIRTNLGKIKRFGSASGLHDFQYTAPKNFEISGIWGRAGRLIDAIGIYLSPSEY